MLLIYKKETGEIIGTNSSAIATFENMYPDALEGFKQAYGGIVVEYNNDYDKNRNWYKIQNGEAIRLASPFIKENISPIIIDTKDQRITDLEMAIASIIGGGA